MNCCGARVLLILLACCDCVTQVAERLCEVWSQRLRVPANKPARAEVKLDAMLECFHDHAVVRAGEFQDDKQQQHDAHSSTEPMSSSSSSSSQGWALATGSAQLREAFDAAASAVAGSAGGTVTVAASEPLQRAYVEIAGEATVPTFCLDIYPPGAAPGFTAKGFFEGNKDGAVTSEAVAVLYCVERSRISQMWVGPAGDAASTTSGNDLPSKGAPPPSGLAGTKLFVGPVLDLLHGAYGPERLKKMQVHVHDYTNIPTVG